jgi:hypothetical protein
MNGAGMDSCADHKHGLTFSERHYLCHGELTFKYQVPGLFNLELLLLLRRYGILTSNYVTNGNIADTETYSKFTNKFHILVILYSLLTRQIKDTQVSSTTL